ncbi:hypothetical protein KZZ04_10610 [Pseudoalteromonas sp. CR1]|uniref:hypothetical protein n=1 Tax=Pseudoalteromonas sp. CR1 TaxID=2861964 RepID=UPI001C5F2D80|nr:hypothetical protein [Pseudoalteromonas sp. CR1]MBW4966817.1 hypothetical protein [Pseudoalteromonas sp. CR1]
MKKLILAGLIAGATAAVTLPVYAQADSAGLVSVLNNATADTSPEQLQADLLAAIEAACSDCSAEDVEALINDAVAAVGADSPLVADVLGAMSAAGIDSDTLTLAAVTAGVDATTASEATAAGNPNAPGNNAAPNSNANPNARSRVPAFVSLPTPPGAGGNGGDDGISEVVN